MKRNKPCTRISHTEKFKCFQFYQQCRLLYLFDCTALLVHSLQLAKVSNKRGNPETIELMKVECEFNQTFTYHFLSQRFISPFFNSIKMSFCSMHNLKCQRNVYMRIQSIKQQFIRCDDNMPYNF